MEGWGCQRLESSLGIWGATSGEEGEPGLSGYFNIQEFGAGSGKNIEEAKPLAFVPQEYLN